MKLSDKQKIIINKLRHDEARIVMFTNINNCYYSNSRELVDENIVLDLSSIGLLEVACTTDIIKLYTLTNLGRKIEI